MELAIEIVCNVSQGFEAYQIRSSAQTSTACHVTSHLADRAKTSEQTTSFSMGATHRGYDEGRDELCIKDILFHRERSTYNQFFNSVYTQQPTLSSQPHLKPPKKNPSNMHFTTATILSALAAIPLASSLGINCRGSYGCQGSSDSLRKLQAAMQSVPNSQFGSGQQIICNANNVSYPSPTSPRVLRLGRLICDGEHAYANSTDLRLLPKHTRNQVTGRRPART